MDNVVLVETPGLDDAFEGDVQILKETAKWLQDTFDTFLLSLN
jgi:predicted unusual protein kinase regulating ubiquinone biosynthesis (AarF/ABC1/UbiB family)